MPRIDAKAFCTTLSANVDNEKLSDAEFRQFVRNSLPIVHFPRVGECPNEGLYEDCLCPVCVEKREQERKSRCHHGGIVADCFCPECG